MEDCTKFSFSDTNIELFCLGFQAYDPVKYWTIPGDTENFIHALTLVHVSITWAFWPSKKEMLVRNLFVFVLLIV